MKKKIINDIIPFKKEGSIIWFLVLIIILIVLAISILRGLPNREITYDSTGALATGTTTVWKSVNISEEAKRKVENFAVALGSTQQDMATRMILAFSTSTPELYPEAPITVEETIVTSTTTVHTTIGESGNNFYIAWIPSQINSTTLSLRILRRINTDPNEYELVRILTTKTPNDGYLMWTPRPTDTGELFIELACVDVPLSGCTAFPLIAIQ